MLIQLCNKAREFDKAAAETEIFAEKYNASSEWARVNRGNPAAVRAAAELAKVALLDTAVFHHKQAQTMKENGDADGAAGEYRRAARQRIIVVQPDEVHGKTGQHRREDQRSHPIFQHRLEWRSEFQHPPGDDQPVHRITVQLIRNGHPEA